MSWDATLIGNIDGNTIRVGDWNYTHNCNRMIVKVLTTAGYEMEHAWFDGDRPGTVWWPHLDGMTGKESQRFLNLILGGMAEAPELFRAMNPENGWGDFDSLMKTLTDMRDAAVKYPSARWETSG